jgi:hypothetical protein
VQKRVISQLRLLFVPTRQDGATRKPAWLLYAAEVRVQLDNMKPTKNGKREADRIYREWLEAGAGMVTKGLREIGKFFCAGWGGSLRRSGVFNRGGPGVALDSFQKFIRALQLENHVDMGNIPTPPAPSGTPVLALRLWHEQNHSICCSDCHYRNRTLFHRQVSWLALGEIPACNPYLPAHDGHSLCKQRFG